MNWGILRLPVWLASTMTLLIPVVSSLAAWLFLDEALTAAQLVAMGVVIGALGSSSSPRRRPRSVPRRTSSNSTRSAVPARQGPVSR
ncbi:MAG: hypothetical protein R2697_05130 [Ilumatobacteraceae bacterium]